MITRLTVKGFKNLIDIDLSLGPFACIAGPNGVGKSNLFDAIQFLSALADKPFIEAARSVRGGEDPAALFCGMGAKELELGVEMIIPKTGEDDFGQPANASATFLEYKLKLQLESDNRKPAGRRIRLVSEELGYIRKGDIKDRIKFSASKAWIESVIKSTKRTRKFISTEVDSKRGAIVILSADRMIGEDKSNRGGGKPSSFPVQVLPRTVLSSAQNADEHRTAVLVRQEMRTWRQLQLEPSFLREPDNFESPDRIDASGAHVPATLWRMREDSSEGSDIEIDIANRLSSLVDHVRSVRVEKDDKRRILRFLLKDSSHLELPASSLSDGTMRFVALAVIERDPEEVGVICLEEPENGIHPQRIDAILDLLYGIACDSGISVDQDNPLRQVLISTHSPVVVRKVHLDDVVFAIQKRMPSSGQSMNGVVFYGVEGSWRHRAKQSEYISDAQIMSYLHASNRVSWVIDDSHTLAKRFGKQFELRFSGDKGLD